jgi:AcrR family transcriptional regulator
MKPMPKSSSAVARRPQILDTALSQFRTRGYVEASVGDIARASDSSTAIIYRHFENKLALFEAVLDREVRRLCDVLDGIADEVAGQAIPFSEAVDRLVAVFTGERMLALMRLVIAEGGIRPQIPQSFQKSVPIVRAAIQRLLESYSGQLYFLPIDDLRVDLFIETLVTGPQLNRLLGLAASNDADRRAMADLRVRALLSMLCAREGPFEATPKAHIDAPGRRDRS